MNILDNFINRINEDQDIRASIEKIEKKIKKFEKKKGKLLAKLIEIEDR